MSEEQGLKLREQVAKLQEEVKLIAKGLKRAADEIDAEWGEELVPSGTEIGGVKF